jgi:hypothetical protein
MRDLHNNIKPLPASARPRAITGNSTTDSQIIDRQGFEAVEFVDASGVITDGQFAYKIQEGDAANLSDVADAAAADCLGAAGLRGDDRQQRGQEDRLQGQEAVLPPPPHAVGCDHRRLHVGRRGPGQPGGSPDHVTGC